MSIDESIFFNGSSHRLLIRLIFLHGPAIAADHDETAGIFTFDARAVAFGDHTPRRDRMAAAGSFACAATHWVIDRVLGDRAAQRANATVAGASSLAENDVFVVDISHLPDGCVAIFVHQPDFTRWQANLGVTFVARHQGGCAPSGADHLPALAGC